MKNLNPMGITEWLNILASMDNPAMHSVAVELLQGRGIKKIRDYEMENALAAERDELLAENKELSRLLKQLEPKPVKYGRPIGRCATGKCGHDDPSWCERK